MVQKYRLKEDYIALYMEFKKGQIVPGIKKAEGFIGVAVGKYYSLIPCEKLELINS